MKSHVSAGHLTLPDRKRSMLLVAILILTAIVLPQPVVHVNAAPDPANIYIVAEWGTNKLSWVDGAGNREEIHDFGTGAGPAGVAIGVAGNYAVTESNRVSFINPTTRVVTAVPVTWPGPGDVWPRGIAIDPSDGWYVVAEYAGKRVTRINPISGATEVVAGPWAAPEYHPQSVATDASGKYYVTFAEGFVIRYNAKTDPIPFGPGPACGVGGQPSGIAVFSDGSLAIFADYANDKLYQIDPMTCVVTQIFDFAAAGAAGAKPWGVAIIPGAVVPMVIPASYVVAEEETNSLSLISKGAGILAPFARTVIKHFDVPGTKPVGVAIASASTIRVTSSPLTGAGYVTVQDAAITTPHDFIWAAGLVPSRHKLEATPTVSGAAGTQYVFTGWSDAGANPHDYTTPAADATVTANYKTQHQLTIQVSPVGGGTTDPAPGTAWYDEGLVPVTAIPAAGYVFDHWEVDGSGGSDNPHQVGLYAAQTWTAIFTSLTIAFNPPEVDIGTSPPGTATITATVTPNVAGKAVVLSYRKDPAAAWTPIGPAGTTDAAGQVSIIWTPPETGTYYFRAEMTEPPLTATSDPASLIVTPEFPLWLAPMLLILSLATVTALLRKDSRRQSSL